jgi:uncharacterized protein (UPF0248 family)
MLLLVLIRSSSVQSLRVTPVHRCWRNMAWYECSVVARRAMVTRSLTTTARPNHQRNAMRDDASDRLRMENIYQEWTLSQDKTLWNSRDEPLTTLAVLLGRGLRGTEQRLAKLKDVDSTAYQRLFVKNASMTRSTEGNSDSITKNKLVPSSEVLRRIQWDENLSSKDFSVIHYDRVDDALVETSVDAPNHSVSGKATKFVDALPEHRIVAVKYKERIVWDREKRMDCVFAGEGIAEVIRRYGEWKKEKDKEEEYNRQRRLYVSTRIQQILGVERFHLLCELWNDFDARSKNDPTLSMKLEAEKYIRSALDLFKEVWRDPDISLMPQWIPASDIESLEILSEFVVLFPDAKARPYILDEISINMQKARGKLKSPAPRDRKLPELDENDLVETFIRGTGPGGQKVNKTSNRVCLVHTPTQLRVECQETRSLPQNRKIARKRLREKLDEHLNGSQSKANLAANVLSIKKAKAKSRSRARIREKTSSEETSLTDSDIE